MNTVRMKASKSDSQPVTTAEKQLGRTRACKAIGELAGVLRIKPAEKILLGTPMMALRRMGLNR